jgi:hypothetical protein
MSRGGAVGSRFLANRSTNGGGSSSTGTPGYAIGLGCRGTHHGPRRMTSSARSSISDSTIILARAGLRTICTDFNQVRVARSTVHRILTGRGVQRLPANRKHRAHEKRWQRYEKPQPGHRVQLDVKFLERIPGTRGRRNARKRAWASAADVVSRDKETRSSRRALATSSTARIRTVRRDNRSRERNMTS